MQSAISLAVLPGWSDGAEFCVRRFPALLGCVKTRRYPGLRDRGTGAETSPEGSQFNSMLGRAAAPPLCLCRQPSLASPGAHSTGGSLVTPVLAGRGLQTLSGSSVGSPPAPGRSAGSEGVERWVWSVPMSGQPPRVPPLAAVPIADTKVCTVLGFGIRQRR